MPGNRLVYAIPNTFCHRIFIHRPSKIPSLHRPLIPFRLIVANTHRNPTPPRLSSRLIPHLHNTLVLNRISILTCHEITISSLDCLKFYVTYRGQSIRQPYRIEENRSIGYLGTCNFTSRSSDSRQRLLKENCATWIFECRVQITPYI